MLSCQIQQVGQVQRLLEGNEGRSGKKGEGYLADNQNNSTIFILRKKRPKIDFGKNKCVANT